MFHSRKARFLSGAVAVAALAVAGLVYAAWTANGTGSGSAKATEAQQLSSVDVAAETTADLYPGANGNVKIRISNPNPYPVRITDVTGNGTITATGGIGTCNTTGVTYSDQHNLSIDVPANGNSGTVTLNNAAHMSNASENGCQGATFTIPVALSGASNAS